MGESWSWMLPGCRLFGIAQWRFSSSSQVCLEGAFQDPTIWVVQASVLAFVHNRQQRKQAGRRDIDHREAGCLGRHECYKSKFEITCVFFFFCDES
jgi:hypothetical protein